MQHVLPHPAQPELQDSPAPPESRKCRNSGYLALLDARIWDMPLCSKLCLRFGYSFGRPIQGHFPCRQAFEYDFMRTEARGGPSERRAARKPAE